MSHRKTKIKKVKMGLYLDQETRARLIQALQCNEEVVYIDDVHFRELCIEEVKSDGIKVEDIKLRRGKIKCLKLCMLPYEEEC
jgi:glycerol-3-phosphate cytidylyltransferase-like family protein